MQNSTPLYESIAHFGGKGSLSHMKQYMLDVCKRGLINFGWEKSSVIAAEVIRKEGV